MENISSEAHLIRFIVINMTNLICALAWATEDGIGQSLLQIKQARSLLDAVIERAEAVAAEKEAR